MANHLMSGHLSPATGRAGTDALQAGEDLFPIPRMVETLPGAAPELYAGGAVLFPDEFVQSLPAEPATKCASCQPSLEGQSRRPSQGNAEFAAAWGHFAISEPPLPRGAQFSGRTKLGPRGETESKRHSCLTGP